MDTFSFGLLLLLEDLNYPPRMSIVQTRDFYSLAHLEAYSPIKLNGKKESI